MKLNCALVLMVKYSDIPDRWTECEFAYDMVSAIKGWPKHEYRYELQIYGFNDKDEKSTILVRQDVTDEEVQYINFHCVSYVYYPNLYGGRVHLSNTIIDI